MKLPNIFIYLLMFFACSSLSLYSATIYWICADDAVKPYDVPDKTCASLFPPDGNTGRADVLCLNGAVSNYPDIPDPNSFAEIPPYLFGQIYGNISFLNNLEPFVLKRDVQRIIAGVKDDFLSPVDPASPSTYLTSRIVNAGLQMADFDTSISDAHRGHTFVLPGDYDKYASATLRTKLQAGGGGNDQISLEFHDINGLDLDNRWGELLSDLVPNWAAETTTLNLNLFSLPDSGGGANTRNLMPFINSKQFLDVRVQDDTNVDFYELILSKNDFISIQNGAQRDVYAIRVGGSSFEVAFAGSFNLPSNNEFVIGGMVAKDEIIEYPPIHPTLVGVNGGAFTTGDFGMWSLTLDSTTFAVKSITVQPLSVSDLNYENIENSTIGGTTVPLMPLWAYIVLSGLLPYMFVKQSKLCFLR